MRRVRLVLRPGRALSGGRPAHGSAWRRVLASGGGLTCLCLAGLLYGCDHGLDAGTQEGTGVAGRITFVGEWPPEVAEVAVAVYENHPQTLGDFVRVSGWDTGIEIGSATHDFHVPLEDEGVYRWVIVAWHSPEGFWDFTSLLGCYHTGSDSLPSPVPVVLGEVADGIDMTIDFAILRGGAEGETRICQGALPPGILQMAGDN